MDKQALREVRLYQLARRLLAGTMTEQEQAEYDALQEAQSIELLGAVMRLARRKVRYHVRFYL